jgi:hypothetical protein
MRRATEEDHPQREDWLAAHLAALVEMWFTIQKKKKDTYISCGNSFG